jgi:serine phosphatase RsbU (regulator of sigma subunit)
MSLETGIALFPWKGHAQSGDRYVVIPSGKDGMLLAVIDGIGHGDGAASAAKIASSVIESRPGRSVVDLFQDCHEALSHTRGVVMSIACLSAERCTMTWLGVGNVQAAVQRAGSRKGTVQDVLLLRGGVVGSKLPALQATSLSFCPGDSLVFATDGIDNDFVSELSPLQSPQECADRILRLHCRGNDDALVLVARFSGRQQ